MPKPELELQRFYSEVPVLSPLCATASQSRAFGISPERSQQEPGLHKPDIVRQVDSNLGSGHTLHTLRPWSSHHVPDIWGAPGVAVMRN